ncbi:DUF922 domain-containing protein [Sphingomonas taxi]|nr:DUF922 domain-containing protein [Sphingomonas taxi]
MTWRLILFAATTPVDPAALERLPAVRIVYYDVHGTRYREIDDDQRRRGPVDPADGQRYDAFTRLRIRWRWPIGRDGRCDVRHPQVTYRITVTLPRLHDRDHDRDAVSPLLRRRWDRRVMHLRVHEAGHVGLDLAYVRRVTQALRHSTCTPADPVAAALGEQLNAATRAYDRITDHGRRQERWHGTDI